MKLTEPDQSEYAPFYHGYISKMIGEDVMDVLQNQLIWLEGYMETLSEEDLQYRYKPEKWSIAEVIGHIVDTERVMSFRMMAFARGDKSDFPGFEQDDYVKNASFSDRSKDSFFREIEGLRKANISLIASFQNETLKRCGMANGSEVTVKALIFILAGHFQHHLEMLFNKYQLNKT